MKTINLSIERKTIPVRFDVVQYATAPSIGFLISDYVLTAAMTARIYIKKPSGAEVYNNCTINVADNTVVYKPTTQSFAEVGKADCQLQITDGTNIAITFKMIADVHENIIDETAPESTDEFGLLQEALNTVDWHEGRVASLEADTVKNNENGTINGSLSITGKLTTNSVLETKGSYIVINNLGDTTNPYETLIFNSADRFGKTYIRAYDVDEDTATMVIKPTGALLLGGGEFASAYYANNKATVDPTERAYLGADSVVHIITNYQDPGNAQEWTYGTSGVLTCPEGGRILLPGNGTIDGLDPSNCNVSIVGLNGSVIPDKTVASSTTEYTELGSFVLAEVGYYFIDVHVEFGSNGTGRRLVNLSYTSKGAQIANKFRRQVPPVPSGLSSVDINGLFANTEANKTIYINCQQNSGASLNVTTRLSVLRLR